MKVSHRINLYLLRAVVALAVILIALAVAYVLYKTRPQPEQSDVADQYPTVRVMLARPIEVARQWSGYGTARAIDSADVPARVTATVAHIPDEIQEGANVDIGDLIARLDATDFELQADLARQNISDIQAQLEQLEVEQTAINRRVELADQNLAIAEANYQRFLAAFENGAAQQQEVDQARQAVITATREQVQAVEAQSQLLPRRQGLQARLRAQQVQLRQAETDIERATIVAPLSGRIQSLDVEVGENLASGQRVARIVNLDRIEVPLLLPAAVHNSISVGDPATLWSTATGEQILTAPIARIAPEIDPLTRTVRMFVVVDESPDVEAEPIVPGRYIRGTVRSSSTQRRSVVPRRSIENDLVYLVEDDRIAAIQVEIAFPFEMSLPQLGIDDTQWLALENDLPADAMVILDASRTLAVGRHVEPVIVNGQTPVVRDADESRGAVE